MSPRFYHKAFFGLMAVTYLAATLAWPSQAPAQMPPPAGTAMQMRQVGTWQVGEIVTPAGPGCIAVTFSASSTGLVSPNALILLRVRSVATEPPAISVLYRDIAHTGPIGAAFGIGDRSFVLEGRSSTQSGFGTEAKFEGGDPQTNRILEQLIETLQQGNSLAVALSTNGRFIGFVRFSLEGSGRAIAAMNACGGRR